MGRQNGIGTAGMNAAMDAPTPVGATRFDIPATPFEAWNAIRSARASASA